MTDGPEHPATPQHTHGHGRDVLGQLEPEGRELRRLIPDVYRNFAGVHRAVMADGALDTRTKELIALAISVTEKCDGCIAAHARGCARAGASEAEVAEAIGVAILMTGGPGTTYGPRALAAFREYAE